MQTIIGYRLRHGTLDDLTETLRAFRSEALRRLASAYSDAVAEETYRLLDLHHAGIRPEEPDAHPVRAAADLVRQSIRSAARGSKLDLDCILQISITAGPTLLKVYHGADRYRDLLDSLPALEPYHWTVDRDASPSLSDEEWEARKQQWDAATPKVKLATGAIFRLLDHQLPSPKWTTIRAKAPDFDERVARVAQARLWIDWQRDKGTARTPFKNWMKTEAGQRSMDREIRRLETIVPDDLSRETLTAFGAPGRRKPATLPTEPVRPTSGATSMIDHADIIESATGDVFVAVMDAGLNPDDRVVIQVTQRQIAFVQMGIDFGRVLDVPGGAIDLLRSSPEVTLIEIRRSEPEEMKARHRALVRDLSLSSSISDLVGGPRTRRATATAS